MKITIDVVNPKFKVGDVIYYEEHLGETNPAKLMVLIENIEILGNFYSDGIQTRIDYDKLNYIFTIQEGYTTANTLIRPGTFLLGNINEVDKVAYKVDWNKPLVSKDTTKNIIKRLKDWNKSKYGDIK